MSMQVAYLSTRIERAITQIPPPSPGRGILGRAANFDIRKSKNGIKSWNWLFNLLGYNNQDDKMYRESTKVLQSCVNQSAVPELYQAIRLRPDFRGQQALLMVHVWLIHRRLAKEGDAGRVLQELVFDRLWEETVLRIRHQQVSELTVNKYLKQVQQVCFNACVAYDKGLERSKTDFNTAIRCHLLAQDDSHSPDEDHVRATYEYIQQNMQMLEKLDEKYLMKGVIPWAQAPKVSDLKQIDIVLIGQKFGKWRTALDIRGQMYYWNSESRLSAWKLPEIDARSQQSKETN
uniref:Uncharacterized protein AlNc14C153G7585 n=1 Tax=Albugo laibachii Nc14 TaxID=890382 RepID=F0WM81_9STRA|nr:conserved hypothetical protein [Albugo laibachii Nc14]|eukprot:CCA22410.1 conserved hypothetical protein [Albugo laibachii Nc14]